MEDRFPQGVKVSPGTSTTVLTAWSSHTDLTSSQRHHNAQFSVDPCFGVMCTWTDRPLTRSNESEAKLHASDLVGARVIWRGRNRSEAEHHQRNVLEFAHYKRDCARAAGSDARARAHEWRQRKLQKERAEYAAQALHGFHQQDFDRPPKAEGRWSQRLKISLGIVKPEDMPSPRFSKRTASPFGGIAEVCESLEEQADRNDASFESVNSHSDCGARDHAKARVSGKSHGAGKLIPEAPKRPLTSSLRIQKGRMQRVLPSTQVDALLSEWTKESEGEREAYRQAFLSADPNGNGRLDARKLHLALEALGLPCSEGAHALTQECEITGSNDFNCFCANLVPQVRTLLIDSRKAKVQHSFTEAAGSRPEISAEECQKLAQTIIGTPLIGSDAIRDIQANMVAVIAEDEQKQDREEQKKNRRTLGGTVGLGFGDEFMFKKAARKYNYTKFAMIIQRTWERFNRMQARRFQEIMKQLALRLEPHILLRMEKDVLRFHACFIRCDADHSGELDIQEVAHMLQEFGFLSGKRVDDQAVLTLMRAADEDSSGTLEFHEFMRLVHQIREEKKVKKKDTVAKVFARFDVDGSGKLNIQEISTLFAEMGLSPKCRDGQLEIKKLLEEIDADSSGDFNFVEFANLVEVVTEKLLAITRFNEMTVGLNLGLTEESVYEYRDGFWALDTDNSGYLEIAEVRRVMQLLKQRMDGDSMRALIQKFNKDGSGRLVFSEFLEMMHAIDSAKQALSSSQGLDSSDQSVSQTEKKQQTGNGAQHLASSGVNTQHRPSRVAHALVFS